MAPKKPIRKAGAMGMDRDATIKAQLPISMKATHDQLIADNAGFMESARRANASRAAGAKAVKLRDESARIKKSGERMARMQAAAKAKRLK